MKTEVKKVLAEKVMQLEVMEHFAEGWLVKYPCEENDDWLYLEDRSSIPKKYKWDPYTNLEQFGELWLKLSLPQRLLVITKFSGTNKPECVSRVSILLFTNMIFNKEERPKVVQAIYEVVKGGE